MHDGDIDYSKFTLLELEEALAGINRQRYPRNYANLRSTYEQRTAATVASARLASEAADDGVARQEPAHDWWGAFWGSRPVLGVAGLVCFWWAYDLLSHGDSCPSGRRLIGYLVKTTCENFGHAGAAGIPIFLGAVSVILAMRPRARSGT